jgi:hypothetical protein
MEKSIYMHVFIYKYIKDLYEDEYTHRKEFEDSLSD